MSTNGTRDPTLTTMNGDHDASALPHDVRNFPRTRHPLVNVFILGLGFFFVMGGYNPCQSFASSLLNFDCIPLGTISIAVIYAALATGSLVAPAIIARWGVWRCLVYTTLAYCAFACSVSYIILPVVLLSSVFIGFFGAFLNIASGVALAECSTAATRGLYSGIFNAFNQVITRSYGDTAHLYTCRYTELWGHGAPYTLVATSCSHSHDIYCNNTTPPRVG